MSSDVKTNLSKLSQPLPSHAIEWRVGSITKDKAKGQAIPYLTFKAVTDRLDELFSPAGWKVSFLEIKEGDKTTGWICSLGIKVEDEWVFKENGAGNTDIEATKGGITDALKRACATWGIGRYLYDFDPPWVPLRNERYLAEVPTLPDAFLPESERKGNKAANKSTVAKAAPATTQEAPVAAAKVEEKQEAPAKTAKVETPAPAAEAATTEESESGIPDEEMQRVNQLIERVSSKKAPKSLVIGYIESGRGAVLSDSAKALIRKKLEAL